MTQRWVACVGDSSSPDAWSGIPYHFFRAGQRQGWLQHALPIDLSKVRGKRSRWGLRRLLTGRQPRGFQYSTTFLDYLESQIPKECLSAEIISFHQHFPRAETVRRHGGRISYYIDATFQALSSGRGLDLQLPSDVVKSACQLERENFALADRVVAMARWTSQSLIDECGVPVDKVFTVLPGANMELPDQWTAPPRPSGRPGKDRPLVLGFVGKDWQRKGLPLLCNVRDILAQSGLPAIVRVLGNAPPEIVGRPGVEFVGFLDKRAEPERFMDVVASCDLGCLFSCREALGISTLEFLRVGVPVAGFVVEGPADTLPLDAGLRFDLGCDSLAIAQMILRVYSDDHAVQHLNSAAIRWSQLVTWGRCIQELAAIWQNNPVDDPVCPWMARVQ